MFDEAGYNECVVRTFRKNAVHTAMVIDDRFPTYADLARGAADTSRFDVGKAELVYQTFKNERIPCDIENDVSRLGEDFEHVRKSDLVVLDYHLRGSDSDSRDAIDILRKLQQSQHFNLVVLYTRDGALDNVWLRVASSLIGGWHKPSELMTPEAYDEWEDLANSEEFEVSKGALAAYILGDDNREERTRLAKVWHDNKRNPKATKDAINAAFHFAALKLTVDGDKSSGEPLKVAGRFNTTGSHWLQCGNVFVAFMQKKRDEDVDRSSVDPEGIMSCLDAALVDWRPNLLKVIISEIQNTLEQTGLAYAEDILRSPEFQAAWIYNVLKEATLQQEGDDRLSGALEELYHRLVQRIERTLSQSRLSEFGVEVFKRAVDIVACASMQEPALMSQAVGLTHSDYDIPPHIVVHALNSYLSSEPFEGTHITAGTVFKAADETGWWVCVSPVCDMVPRPSRDGRSWQKELEPVRPVVALRLYEEGNAAKALEEAERGRILFIFNGAAPLCLRAFHDESRQPWTESLFLCSQGWQDEGGQKRFTFQGQRAKHKDGIAEVTLSDFEAVAQLRESYTGRLLQQTGAYTSRIGVDYVPLTAERVRREPAPAPSVETLVSTPEQQ